MFYNQLQKVILKKYNTQTCNLEPGCLAVDVDTTRGGGTCVVANVVVRDTPEVQGAVLVDHVILMQGKDSSVLLPAGNNNLI